MRVESLRDAGNEKNISLEGLLSKEIEIPQTWVVVADEEIARVFARGGRQLEPVATMIPTPMDLELDNDTVGRQGAYGAGRHKIEPTMEESRKEQIHFAREIAGWLEKALNDRAFDKLVLVAAPQALGELRHFLSKRLQSMIVAEINKELTNHNQSALEQELVRLIPGSLRQ